MAQCAYCTAETELYDGGEVPFCTECSYRERIERKPPTWEHKIRNTLHEELWAATERARETWEAFTAITENISRGSPHPDRAQRIRNASRDVSLTRAELMRVHKRVQDYLGGGIVPEDLKPCR